MIKRSYKEFLKSYIKESDSEDRAVKINYTGKEDIHDQLLEFFLDIEDNFDVNVVIPKNFLIDGRPELGVNISPSTNKIEDVNILELFEGIWTSVGRVRKMGLFETLIYDSKGTWGQIRLSRNPFEDIVIKFNDLMIEEPSMILNEIQNFTDMETIENWIISLDFQIAEAKYKEKTKLNENISLAKSIMKRSGIDSNSPEWGDYLKIREMCGNSHGYVGILTRIRFEDGVTDMDEIRSIFDILKGSKIDLSKLNKMSYSDILDRFYDKFSKDSSDIEIVFSDSTYTYYSVKTYEGILEIGSPAWCLKTKSNWDLYQSKYPQQWVAIDNRYKNKLLTPKTTTLQTYSPSKGWTRFGFSIKIENDMIIWSGNDDGNRSVQYKPENYTAWGVLSTIFNLASGIKKSYWERFPGCQLIEGSKKLHKIVDLEVALKKLKMENSDLEISGSKYEIYLNLSETYSHLPLILILDEEYPRALYPYKKKTTILPTIIGGSVGQTIIEDYAKKSKSDLYVGLKLKNGVISEEEANIGSIGKVDKWLIFDKGDRYLCVNLNPPNKCMIPTLTMIDEGCDIDDPLYFYLNKSKLRPVSFRGGKIPIKSHHQMVIDYLNKGNQKRIRGFWNFLRNK